MGERTGGAWILRCDGGSRGNPGPGAAAYVLSDPSGAECEARGLYLGSVTNNVAEYRALIEGLEAAARHGIGYLTVRMDSELVVRQMTGVYRVKHAGLKPLHEQARKAAGRFKHLDWESVPRDDNTRADRLVNDTLDDAMGTESPR
jgi:ribonuclease HI